VRLHGLDDAITITNPESGVDGFGMVIELLDDGSEQDITWGDKYQPRYEALPAKTAEGYMLLAFKYEADADEWCLMGIQHEAL
jgi:hypothetical protein